MLSGEDMDIDMPTLDLSRRSWMDDPELLLDLSENMYDEIPDELLRGGNDLTSSSDIDLAQSADIDLRHRPISCWRERRAAGIAQCVQSARALRVRQTAETRAILAQDPNLEKTMAIRRL